VADKNKRRRNAFEPWEQQPDSTRDPESIPPLPSRPPTPIDLIPAAELGHRNRGWDQQHRAWSYKIPDPLRQRALEIRDAITGIAQSGSATTDEIAFAFISLALSHVERGIFTPQGRTDPRRQKMAVVWEESESKRPQEIPPKKVRNKKPAISRKNLFLAYRWPASVHQQLCRISGNTLARGEVVVALLQHSLDAYRHGSLRLKFQPRITISGEWS
jgi:hypothetical protein